MTMKQFSVWTVAGLISMVTLISVMTVMSGPAWACKGAGPNTHVGVITQLNAKDLQFTITDAETGEPMKFIADSKQLAALSMGDQIAVSYEDHNGTMVAKRIQ
jgi:hypothetical protein